MPDKLTIPELNAQAKRFWSHQQIAMEHRLRRPQLLAAIERILGHEQFVGVPIYCRHSFESALAQVESIEQTLLADEETAKEIRSRAARKAGCAAKADALTTVIKGIVFKRPNITVKELIVKLENEKGHGVIEDVGDGRIWFRDKKGRSKSALSTALRGRLSRAKAQFRRTKSR